MAEAVRSGGLRRHRRWWSSGRWWKQSSGDGMDGWSGGRGVARCGEPEGGIGALEAVEGAAARFHGGDGIPTMEWGNRVDAEVGLGSVMPKVAAALATGNGGRSSPEVGGDGEQRGESGEKRRELGVEGGNGRGEHEGALYRARGGGIGPERGGNQPATWGREREMWEAATWPDFAGRVGENGADVGDDRVHARAGEAATWDADVGEVELNLAPKIGEKWGKMWRSWRGTGFTWFGCEGASGRAPDLAGRGRQPPTMAASAWEAEGRRRA
uniref:DUF834 domain-containing protein n=1 Tax=Oryza sativa subsp. japonica TaxID=39947 RepID=Q6K8I0_ORYSJ|nr:hypothetical protein [Oryza sativa Japonica Group]